jgi:hypothetical protein
MSGFVHGFRSPLLMRRTFDMFRSSPLNCRLISQLGVRFAIQLRKFKNAQGFGHSRGHPSIPLENAAKDDFRRT